MAFEHLPDTPWHIGYTKKEDDDPRRHKARCIKYCKGECRFYNEKCRGSSHCVMYAEDEEQWKQVYENTRTVEELAEIAKDKYKAQMIRKRKEFEVSYTGAMVYRKVCDITECPVCGERLNPPRDAVKVKCRYCEATICNEKHARKLDYPVIVIGKKRNTNSDGIENRKNEDAKIKNVNKGNKKIIIAITEKNSKNRKKDT